MSEKSSEQKLRAYLERATSALRQSKQRIRELEAQANEPIAIVGMACRFPGGARTPAQLWELLDEGRDAISPMPTDRGWRLEELIDEDRDKPGTTYTHGGGFLEHPARFDPLFFNVSPREAAAIDPQQRLLLSLAWEALEHARIIPESLYESSTGVFVGLCYDDYLSVAPAPGQAEDGYATLGNLYSVASGRIAYTLGLQGPALTLDTACSTSLVTVHLAVQALRKHECDLALAGGATVFSTPEPLISFSRLRTLSPDGRCKAFSAKADGAGWAEGGGMLVLERLSDARRNGHPVLAVVKGSAINQDGRSQGLTAPNGPSQQRVIRAALASAGLDPNDVDAVEAHGTGTPLGDPIEAHALTATYGRERSSDAPLYLGSIKSNIGHTQAAAGVAGIIKMVLAMQYGRLPRTLHAETPSPKIDWSSGTLELLREPKSWAPGERPRRAAVSSFGISGTNAHIILEEAPPAAEVEETEESEARPPPSALPLVFSAKHPESLRTQASRLRAHMERTPDLSIVDLAHSLVSTRSSFAHRAGLVVSGRDQALETLSAIADGTPSPRHSINAADSEGKLVFVFPGQGSQWRAMARALLEQSPVFAAKVRACTDALSPHVDWDLSAVLRGDPDAPGFDRVDVVQPVLWAMMVSLAALWRSFGISPDAVVGHSQGEIAAACVAGALSLEDAAKIIALRSKVITSLEGTGAMAAVSLSAEELSEVIEEFSDSLAVAVDNGPQATVASGDPEAIDRLVAKLEAAGTFARKVKVNYASHCAHIDAIRAELEQTLEGIVPREAEIPFYSTVEGRALAGTELGPDYWYRNLRQRVRFNDAVTALVGDEHRFFIEVSAHPVLSVALNSLLAGGGGAFIPTLRRDEGQLERALLSLTELHGHGYSVDWVRFYAPYGPKVVELPTYAFLDQACWSETHSQGPSDVAAFGIEAVEHPLLRASVPLAEGPTRVFSSRLSSKSPAWVTDHLVFGRALLPGAGFVEAALFAARTYWPKSETLVVDELTLFAPLVLDDEPLQFQLLLDDRGAERAEISIYSQLLDGQSEDEWIQHARGRLATAPASAYMPAAPSWPPAGAEPVDLEPIYDRLHELGLRYGPSFRGLRRAWRDEETGTVFAEVELPPLDDGAEGFIIHPALLDAVFHTIFIGRSDRAQVLLPFALRRLTLQRLETTRLRVVARPQHEQDRHELSLEAWTSSGRFVLGIDGLRLRPLELEQLRAARHKRDLYRLAWVEASSSRPRGLPPRIAVVGAAARDRSTFEATGLSLQSSSSWDEFVEAQDQASAEPPPLLIFRYFEPASELTVAGVHERVEQAVDEARQWLESAALAGARLVWVTRGAAHIREDGVDAPELAALWGVARALRAEHPDRPLLSLDLGQAALPRELLPELVHTSERELAVIDGALHSLRLEPTPADDPAEAPTFAGGTTLIVGGTGLLGARLALHLVRVHGVHHLTLSSRRGSRAPGAPQLRDQLMEAGAESVDIIECDVTKRRALANLLEAIPEQRPLRAVFHVAGILDDAPLTKLSPEQLHRVLSPKVDGALHLHELTQTSELAAFVLFSSAAGTLGTPGQANYAAANAFLDGLARHRRARGLPAMSLAWGLWTQGGMTEHLSEADFARLRRGGLRPLPFDDGFALLDRALDRDEASLVPVKLDLRSLRARTTLQPLLWSLVPARAAARAGTSDQAASLPELLAEVSGAERAERLAQLLAPELTKVLRLPGQLDPDQPLRDLGLDSLMAVEFRNQLEPMTGLSLPSTLLFDFPTLNSLVEYLLEKLESSTTGPTLPSAAIGDEEIRRRLALIPLSELRKAGVLDTLMKLAPNSTEVEAKADADIDEMSVDQLVGMVLAEDDTDA